MEYVIAIAAGLWMVPAFVLERRAGGGARLLVRILGNVPFLVLVVLAWLDRFSYQALMIDLYVVVVLGVVGLVLDERRKRRARSTEQHS
jgi:hypothetical protein